MVVASTMNRGRGTGSSEGSPIVLLHGFMQSHHTFDEVVGPLEKAGYRVIAPDLVGHGEAPRTHDEQAYTLEAIGAEILRLLDDEGIGTVNLVGYSMGGRVAASLSLAHPERIESLILESAGVGPRDEDTRDALRLRDEDMIKRLRDEGIEAFVDWWEKLPLFATQRFLPEETRARVRAERLANDPETMALVVEQCGQHTMTDMRRKLSDAKFPLLYLAGTDDMKYREVAADLAQFGGIDVKLIEAGHDTHLENPAGFARAVLGYLDAQGL